MIMLQHCHTHSSPILNCDAAALSCVLWQFLNRESDRIVTAQPNLA